ALFGNRLSGDGDRISIAAIAVSFIASIAVLVDVIGGTSAALDIRWAQIGQTVLRMGFQVDALTATMLVVVTLISLLVQIYSLGYMHGDRRYKRYFCVISLFTFSMLGLVLADNLFMLFIFWELVGLCSYLLISHWFEKREAGSAAMKAFLTTRVGDIGMFIGIMWIWAHTGTFSFSGIKSEEHTSE